MLPGQQLVQMPDGKLQIFSSQVLLLLHLENVLIFLFTIFFITGCFPPQAWPRCKSAWRRDPTTIIANPNHPTNSHPCQVQPKSTISSAETHHSGNPLPPQDLHHPEEPQRPCSSKCHSNSAKTNRTHPTAANTSNTNPNSDPCSQLHPRHPQQAEHGGGNPESGGEHSHHQGRPADRARA